MKKFKELPFYKQVTRVYTYSLFCSILFSPLFGKIYLMIFHPRLTSGLSIFPQDRFFLFDGIIEASLVFIPFFSLFLLEKRKISVWFFGFILPFFFIANSLKEIAWAIFLTFIGWGLARFVLFVKKSKNK